MRHGSANEEVSQRYIPGKMCASGSRTRSLERRNSPMVPDGCRVIATSLILQASCSSRRPGH